MISNFLFTEDDLKNKTHFPVIAFFNIISSGKFPEIIEMLADGRGCGYEFACCLFPNDVDIVAERFDGVEFSLHNGEEVVLNYTDFYDYLKKACERHVLRHPQNKVRLDLMLEKAKQKFIS